MPNYCSYEMKVQGKPEKVEEFLKVIKSRYDYGNNEFDFDRHLSRVFDATIFVDEVNNGIRTVELNGYCAWSVYSCMCEGEHTYYDSFKENHGDESKATTIQKESKNLELAIQVYSEESGMGFQEHYVYLNGKAIAEDCVDWKENYIDDEEKLQEYNEEHGTSYTMEELENNDNKFPEGGFEEWSYEDYSNEIK